MPSQPDLQFVQCPVPPLARARGDDAGDGRRMAYWNWPALASGSARHVVVCVHGLSRQGRDFDVLARALQPWVRVVCPDVAGRGHSDWLQDPMAYQVPTYAQDMAALLAVLRQQGVETIDWVGTSMGGLIGMALASKAGLGIRRLVLNDVGPALEPVALLRIGAYLGLGERFDDLEQGADHLRSISAGFGPHSQEQWRALSEPMFKRDGASWVLHYDPAIAVPFRLLDAESAVQVAAQGQAALWALYDDIRSPTLLIRGEQSDLLSEGTAQLMTQRGPRAKRIDLPNVGHAPTLVQPQQIEPITDFLLDH